MTHECYYNKDKSRRQRLLVNKTFKTRKQITQAAKKAKPKTAPATLKLERIKIKDLMLEIRG